MAKIKYSALVSGMRNKLNGSVLSKNRYGNYIRNKTTPVNPQTLYQQNQRQQLGTLSSGWRSLTENQRAAWRLNSANFPTTDIFGDVLILAGNALYVGLNKNLLNASQTTIADVPTPVAIPTFSAVSLAADSVAATVEITVSAATVPAGYTMLVYATGSTAPGISFVKNRLRLIGTATATTSVADVSTKWLARFGTLIAGEKVTCRIALISNTTGQAGVPTEVVAIIS